MSVAALYDIHGNLPALEAVLEDVRRAGADLVVVGGDVVPGPMPRESLLLLLSLDSPTQFIQGNGEVAVLEQRAGREPLTVPEAFRPAIRWSADQLDQELEQTMRAWPKTLRIDVHGVGETLFCHGTPRDENEIFTARTPEQALLPIFQPLDMALVVCGHTHMQFDRHVGVTRVVNAGSVGMPFGTPGADWLLLGPDVQFRHTSYDLRRAADRIRATSYPDAPEFAEHHVLAPPSADEMVRAFSGLSGSR